MAETAVQYAALPLPLDVAAVGRCADRQEARLHMRSVIDRCDSLVRAYREAASKGGGAPLRLVVLPESFLTGSPAGESVGEWQSKACISPDGEEYEALGHLARHHGIFLSGNAFELDAGFPELYFQTSFIVDPAGDVILRYRRLISMSWPTPHDVLDAYLDRYGDDSLFPVVETELGRLACVASEEIIYPEIARAHALRGAEVVCHSTSPSARPPFIPGNIARRARACENMVYIVSAASAGVAGDPGDGRQADGRSQVVDHRGGVLTEAGRLEDLDTPAVVDIGEARRARARASVGNTLSRLRLGVFRKAYELDPVYPRNTLLYGDAAISPGRDHFLETQQAVIESLMERGII